MKSTVSARVRIQLLRMVRLEYWGTARWRPAPFGHQPTISNSGALLTFAHCPISNRGCPDSTECLTDQAPLASHALASIDRPRRRSSFFPLRDVPF
jgi:hypothetical protein